VFYTLLETALRLLDPRSSTLGHRSRSDYRFAVIVAA
jgi:hypothetical protein